jgi:hypothetical protein
VFPLGTRAEAKDSFFLSSQLIGSIHHPLLFVLHQRADFFVCKSSNSLDSDPSDQSPLNTPPLLPLLNFDKYLRYLSARIETFLEFPSSARREDQASRAWIAEALLELMSSSSSNLTPATLAELLVSRWRSLQHEFVPPSLGEVFHCHVRSVDVCASTGTPLLLVSPFHSVQTFRLWLHASFEQFVDTSLLRPGRSLRLVSSAIINDVIMLPTRAVLIELDALSSSDVRWVRSHSQQTTLASLGDAAPGGVLVRVAEVLRDAICVVDDSGPPGRQLVLGEFVPSSLGEVLFSTKS